MSKQWAFSYDSASCSGCKACVIACLDKNGEPGEQPWRRVHEISGGEWIKKGSCWENTLFVYHLSLSCNHCEKPICVEVCPTRSMRKREDGIVYVNRETCIGCRYCEWACPYSSPQYSVKLGKMTKCDFCRDLIDRGQRPACVSACGLRALDCVDRIEIADEQQLKPPIPPMPPDCYTEPSTIIKPHGCVDDPLLKGEKPVMRREA